MGLIRDWRRRRILERGLVDETDWRATLARHPLLAHLSPEEGERLRGLATLFLHEKRFSGTHGLEPQPQHRLAVAAQACLPILNLGPDWLAGWVEVILYPDPFIVEGEEVDEAGVVHPYREVRSGEAWQHGPLILAWSEVESGGRADGFNVVIHEIAHKLDGRNGALDGTPPLHPEMSRPAWIAAFTEAYEELHRLLDAGAETLLDPYAAEAPAEFFAVVSEAFFETPWFLADYYPGLYAQLAAFYRQDPRQRLDY